MNPTERFFEDAMKVVVDPNDTIQRSYQHFVRYFVGLENLTEHNVVIACHFTYGWMPTMLDLRGDLETTIVLLNKVKTEGARLTVDEFKILTTNINGSVVGTSKLLHFIRPDVHSIWDSRVYRYLHQKEPHHYRLDNPKEYHVYLERLAELKVDKRFPAVRQRIEKKLGYAISDNRAGEFVMYQNGRKPPKVG